MILKVVHSQARTISNYKVVYESGSVRKYTHRNVPKSILKFINNHHCTIRFIGSDWTIKTYLYDRRREVKDEPENLR